MSLLANIENTIVAFGQKIKSWVAPEVSAGKAFLSELESEVDAVGPQLLFDVCSAALQAVSAGTGTTGAILTAAADIAIKQLKSEGKKDITVAVYGSLAAAMLKMNATAAATGVTVPALPAATVTASA